ncbi:putative ubiquitin carrier protein [Cladorrhinum sp. PSN332]|nr:putative ubiquitin carrier protein [Cladorrhinum sp. PSN332]
MTSTRERRVLKELSDLQNDSDHSGVSATLIDPSNFTHLRGTLPGPPDTPYAGGTFAVDIQIPDTYPFKSPIMKFETKIWHPNVSSVTGAICLDILGTGWSPVGTIKMALISLRMLLETPNPKDPQDAEVAKMMMEQPDAFAQKAHDWAVMHAGAPRREQPKHNYKPAAAPVVNAQARYQGYSKDLVDRFVNMGFDVEAVVDAFQYVGIDRNGGEDYELEEAYMGDITARLLGEN